MTDEQLKTLLDIIIERLYNIPNNDYMLKYNYPYQNNVNHITLVTIEPINLRLLFSRSHLKITIYTLSELNRSDCKVYKLYNRYYLKTVKETIKNKNRLYQVQKDLKFKEALKNTIEGL
jgi:hypothetical protein